MQGGAGKAKLSERPKNVDIQHNHSHKKRKDSIFQTIFPFLMTMVQLKKNLQKKKEKSDNGENLDSSCGVVQLEESANSANTLNIQSISKSENSAKSSVVIASSSETSSPDENGKKLDMILSEISMLNSKLSNEIKR